MKKIKFPFHKNYSVSSVLSHDPYWNLKFFFPMVLQCSFVSYTATHTKCSHICIMPLHLKITLTSKVQICHKVHIYLNFLNYLNIFNLFNCNSIFWIQCLWLYKCQRQISRLRQCNNAQKTLIISHMIIQQNHHAAAQGDITTASTQWHVPNDDVHKQRQTTSQCAVY